MISAKNHYNHVTDAWKEFMGDNFHFGYFETGKMDLSSATESLIDKMLELCDVSGNTKILDVGCGIGGPAFYIHEKFKCAVDGISTSERGIQLAAASGKKKGYGNVRFRVADGEDNGFPDGCFDIVWVMESSHLMADKKRFFRECFRVLNGDGIIVLCDLILLKLFPFHREIAQYVLHGAQYIRLIHTWGNARLNSLGTYCNGLIEAGFNEVTAIDITDNTIPTLEWWKKNALRHGDDAMQSFSKKDVRAFIKGCEILEDFFLKGIFGYGMLKAIK